MFKHLEIASYLFSRFAPDPKGGLARMLYKIFNRLVNIGAILGTACILFIMAIITINVITRAFDTPIIGIYELTEVLLMAASGFVLAYTAAHEANIDISVLTNHLPKKVQTLLKVIASLTSLIIWGIIVWQSVQLIFKRGLLNERTDVLNLVYFPFRFLWILGLVLMCIAFLFHFLSLCKGKN